MGYIMTYLHFFVNQLTFFTFCTIVSRRACTFEQNRFTVLNCYIKSLFLIEWREHFATITAYFSTNAHPFSFVVLFSFGNVHVLHYSFFRSMILFDGGFAMFLWRNIRTWSNTLRSRFYLVASVWKFSNKMLVIWLPSFRKKEQWCESL